MSPLLLLTIVGISLIHCTPTGRLEEELEKDRSELTEILERLRGFVGKNHQLYVVSGA